MRNRKLCFPLENVWLFWGEAPKLLSFGADLADPSMQRDSGTQGRVASEQASRIHH